MHIGIGIGLDKIRRAVAAIFSPLSLFSNSEQGVWYDPSDMDTLYQDSAGTTPVTAVEQPVGLMLDKSGNDNHAFQATSAARPTLKAKYNLLTYTEQFDNAFWKFLNSATVTANATTAPNGTTTADKIEANSANTNNGAFENTVSLPIGSKFSVWAKADTVNWCAIGAAGLGPWAWFDLQNGVIGNKSSNCSTRITSAGDGWYLCEVYDTTIVWSRILIGPKPSEGNNDPWSFVDNAISDSIFIWGADGRVTNDGVDLPAYQRVGAATDYDTVGFPVGEVFDGTDDAQITSAGGGATTAFFYCASIRVNKVSATQTLFSDTGTNTGYRVRINSSNQLEFSAGDGSAYTTVNTTATLSIGERVVITCWHDGVNINSQINNGTVAQAAFATATAGTAAITLGKDNGAASSFFNGTMYEVIYVKDEVQTASEMSDTKDWCANIANITL